MSSIIEGYTYEIFISYRQKDNRYDGWVTEFVDNLTKELEATFKEEVTAYFDINPHDGLLETHDVHATLKEKLKCLIFIPIISRTYCDPKSYAWQHEFKEFVEQASKDKFGLRVRLPNGNVANRVLPVRIHDLDNDDIKLCESILGGPIRGVDFIFKYAGVNRPLRAREDSPGNNLNKTYYRDQINKVALSIKEIISGMRKGPEIFRTEKEEFSSTIDKPTLQEKSIIVLPFENISPDPDQEYFSDGLTEEIITDLSRISDLLVISRSSAMTFKGTNKTIPEIVNAVNVRYVLEGSVRKSGNNLRITAQLIDAMTDTHIWAEKYAGLIDDIFDIQEKVSHSIMEALKLKFGSLDKQKISAKQNISSQLHDCYLKARHEIYKTTKESIDQAVRILQNGLEVFGENALLYATLAEAKYYYYEIGSDLSERNLNDVEDYAKKALSIEPDIAQGYKLYGMLERGRGSLIESYKYLKKAYNLDPNDPGIITFFAILQGLYLGIPNNLDSLHKRLFDIDPLSSANYMVVACNEYTQGHFKKAVELLQISSKVHPEFVYSDFWLTTFLAANGQKDEALEMTDKIVKDQRFPAVLKELTMFLKHSLLAEKELALKSLSDITKLYTWKDPDLSGFMPGYYALIHENDLAYKYLDHSLNRGFVNYPFFSAIDPFLENIRGEEQFKILMKKMKLKWESLEL
jgi:TolB-like protein